MTIDGIKLNGATYLDTGINNMFTDTMLMPTTPLFDFSSYMPGTYMAMDSFFPTMPSYPSFNFEMPQIDFGMLIDMYNTTIQNCKNQFNQFQQMFFNSNFNWNTTPTASLSDVNYDANAAKKLAQNATSHAGARSQKRCAEFVSDAIEASGISITRGHAYQMENNLRNNPNFKEVKVSQNELASLPAGCILVYPRGSAGYSSQYGHIEITLGDGKAASDFVNTNPKYSSDMKVFVPVSA